LRVVWIMDWVGLNWAGGRGVSGRRSFDRSFDARIRHEHAEEGVVVKARGRAGTDPVMTVHDVLGISPAVALSLFPALFLPIGGTNAPMLRR